MSQFKLIKVYLDGVLEIRTWGIRMEGADESTELHMTARVCLNYKGLGWILVARFIRLIRVYEQELKFRTYNQVLTFHYLVIKVSENLS